MIKQIVSNLRQLVKRWSNMSWTRQSVLFVRGNFKQRRYFITNHPGIATDRLTIPILSFLYL